MKQVCYVYHHCSLVYVSESVINTMCCSVSSEKNFHINSSYVIKFIKCLFVCIIYTYYKCVLVYSKYCKGFSSGSGTESTFNV